MSNARTPESAISGLGSSEGWAAVNLAMALLGSAIVIAALAFHKSRSYAAKRAVEPGQPPASRERGSRTIAWETAVCLCGVLGLAFFVLSEDVTDPVTLVDSWTIVQAALFLLTVAAAGVLFLQQNSRGLFRQSREAEEGRPR
jgi:hypothetical protein